MEDWWRSWWERRQEPANGLGGELYVATLLLGGLLDEVVRDTVTILDESSKEGHKLVGPREVATTIVVQGQS